MTSKNKNRFKNLGNDILGRSQKPASMKEFLNDTPKTVDAQMHSRANAQMHKTGDTDQRLHVFITSSLSDKLTDEVYRRKKDPKFDKAKASKRGIVEDALKNYLSQAKLK